MSSQPISPFIEKSEIYTVYVFRYDQNEHKVYMHLKNGQFAVDMLKNARGSEIKKQSESTFASVVSKNNVVLTIFSAPEAAEKNKFVDMSIKEFKAIMTVDTSIVDEGFKARYIEHSKQSAFGRLDMPFIDGMCAKDANTIVNDLLQRINTTSEGQPVPKKARTC